MRHEELGLNINGQFIILPVIGVVRLLVRNLSE